MNKPSLAQFEVFAAAHPTYPRRPCSVCVLPPDLLTVLHQAHGRGHNLGILTGFLVEHGHPEMNRQRLDRHFRNGHHNVKADSRRR